VSALSCWASGIIQQVPAQAPAYKQLRLLEQRGMLSTVRENLLSGVPPRQLTRYDFAFLLIEPLERFSALIEAQENPSNLAPEQRQRKELAYQAISILSPDELDQLLATTTQMLLTFGDVIEELSPGLTNRAGTALRKLGLPRFRPWSKPAIALRENDASPVVRVAVDPKATPNSFGDPLPPLRPTHTVNPEVLAFSQGNRVSLPAGKRPINSLEAAIQFAYGPIRLYGSLASQPGQDPALLLKPDSSGKAMVGFQVNIGQINDLGVSGIFEYHVMRSGDAGNVSVNTGAVGGIGLSW